MKKIKYNGEEMEFYSGEELLKSKKSSIWVKKHLLNNLLDIMMQEVGKDYLWGKEHDMDSLHIIDLLMMPLDQYNEMRKLFINIIKRQYSMSKTQAEKEFSWFSLCYGLPVYQPDENVDKNKSLFSTKSELKSNISRRIYNYEITHGELKYTDGWEKELKESIDYDSTKYEKEG